MATATATRCRLTGHHVPPAQPDAEELHWYPTLGLPLRHEAHTCACQPVSYEYGVIGGAYRIRRTTRATGQPVRVHETPAVRRTLAAEWWRKVQAGQAV